MKQVSLDGNILSDHTLVHNYLKEQLDFPEYYGKNLDALFDCLTDLDDIEIMISAPVAEHAAFQKITAVFQAAANENRCIHLTIL